MNQNKKKILLTGASGFLGSHLIEWLSSSFFITTIGRKAQNDLCIDLCVKSLKLFQSFDIIVHSAGKVHSTPKTKKDELVFFDVNYKGTLNLLKGLESCPARPKLFIFISTVAVYGLNAGEFISETAALKGESPYAKSKILAEQAVQTWCEENGVQYVILRLPLVVGKNPPGNLGAMYKAIKKGKYFKISDNKARKSVVLAEDIVRLIPKLEGKQGIYNLTDGVHPYFKEIENAIELATGSHVSLSLPVFPVKAIAQFGSFLKLTGLPTPFTNKTLNKMLSTLTFSDEKAKKELEWQPRPVLPWITQFMK